MKDLKIYLEGILDIDNHDLDDFAELTYDKNQYKKIEEYLITSFFPIRYDNISFGKDKSGKYYISTKGSCRLGVDGYLDFHKPSQCFNEYREKYNKIRHKDCPEFYWKEHEGAIYIAGNCQNFESVEGLPEKIDMLVITEGSGWKKPIDLLKHKIDTINIHNSCEKGFIGHPKVKIINYSGWMFRDNPPAIKGFTTKLQKK